MILPGPGSLASGCLHYICSQPMISIFLPRAPGPQMGWVGRRGSILKESEVLQLVHELESEQRLGRGPIGESLISCWAQKF